MRRAISILITVLAASFAPERGAAQTFGQPGGAPMSEADANAMAERMMLDIGGKLGVDPEAMRNATPERRKALLQAGAEGMADRMRKQMEASLGMSLEEAEGLSEDELRARMETRFRPPVQEIVARPLAPAPAQGFPDGAAALPVGADLLADLTVSGPAGAEVLLVVADVSRRDIVLRETRVPPFDERLNLAELAGDPNSLVIEVINPQSRRVISRYRPVARE